MALRKHNYIKVNMNNFSTDIQEDDEDEEERLEKDIFHIEDSVVKLEVIEDDDKINDEDIYLQIKTSHTSGSLDCSSAGSIPWAEDSIKLNQLEWEKIENLLNGRLKFEEAEDDKTVDAELRKEILDWQHKFPELLKENLNQQTRINEQLTYFSDSDDYLNNSNDDNDDDDNDNYNYRNQLVKCQKYRIRGNSHKIENIHRAFTQFSIVEDENKDDASEENNLITDLRDDFTLTSVRCKLNRREQHKNSLPKLTKKRSSSNNSQTQNTSRSTTYELKRHNSKQQTSNLPQFCHSSRLRMPPILNTPKYSRKFSNLEKMKPNQSFIQLTAIPQQAKSAVIRLNNVNEYGLNDNDDYDDNDAFSSQRTIHMSKTPSAWLGHIERTRNRCCFNNRNAVILPAIPTRPPIIMHHSRNKVNHNSNQKGGNSHIVNHHYINRIFTTNSSNDRNFWSQKALSKNTANRHKKRGLLTCPFYHEFDAAVQLGITYDHGDNSSRKVEQRATSSLTNSSSLSGRSISALPIVSSYDAISSTYNTTSNMTYKYSTFK